MPEAITVMAFDYGIRRIGVAIGNSLTQTSQALPVITQTQTSQGFEAIKKLLVEWQPARLAVGLPVHPDGAEHAMTAKARRFGQQLQGRFALPVAWVDERYTSAVLENEPNLAPQAKDQLDSHAACLILEQYFQENLHPLKQNKA